MLKGNLKWIIIFGALGLVCLGIITLQNNMSGPGAVAEISVDGHAVRTVSLDEDIEFTVETDGGYNTVRVQSGKIAVVDASCPDGLCMKRGYIGGGGLPIVCLPNRLVVQVHGGAGGMDAEV